MVERHRWLLPEADRYAVVHRSHTGGFAHPFMTQFHDVIALPLTTPPSPHWGG